MSKRCLIFSALLLAVLFSVYVGYRFHDNRVKPIPIGAATQFESGEEIESTNRAFLQRAEAVDQMPRDIKKRFPSLKPPAWTYTPKKWDGGGVDSVQVVALATDVVGFHATKLPNGNTYRLPLPKERVLLEGDIISDQEVIYIRIFTTPENTPEFPPSFHELRIPSDVPIPYPLIAKAFDSPDDATLTQLRDWIKSVGGAARAQSLLEAAGLSDSIRIETATSFRQ